MAATNSILPQTVSVWFPQEAEGVGVCLYNTSFYKLQQCVEWKYSSVRQSLEELLFKLITNMEEDNNLMFEVYHLNRHIAKHAASYMKQEIVELCHGHKFNLKKFIMCLVRFHKKYSKALDSEPLLIDALIDDCKFLLEDWEAWTDILLKQKLRDNKALIVTKMLAACIWITATGYVPVSRAKTLPCNFKIETSSLRQKAMTEHFVKHLPQMINKYERNEHILMVLAIVPCSFHLEMRQTLDMTQVVKTLLDFYVTSNNKLLDLQLCKSMGILLSEMENPPEWHDQMCAHKEKTAHNIFLRFKSCFEKWYLHDESEGPFHSKWKFTFYLSKVVGFATIIHLVHEGIIDYSIQGLYKLFHDEVMNESYNYEIANRFVILFHYGTSDLMVQLQQCLDFEEILEYFVSKFWPSIQTGFQLMSKMLLNEHPTCIRRFHYILYTDLLCRWTKLITYIPYLKACQYKVKHETVLNINYILRKTVDSMKIPEESEVEMWVKVLSKYCELLQCGIIDCYNVAHICDYFKFYKQKHLYNDILKKTIYHLLQNRHHGIIVADMLLQYIYQLYLSTKDDVEMKAYVMTVAKAIEKMLPRNSVRIAKPLLHFVKTGINFAAEENIGFLQLLSMFALRLTHRKAMIIELYFMKTLHKHFRHPDYKYFALRIGEYTRRLKRQGKS